LARAGSSPAIGSLNGLYQAKLAIFNIRSFRAGKRIKPHENDAYLPSIRQSEDAGHLCLHLHDGVIGQMARLKHP
jgi:hypothetical protein